MDENKYLQLSISAFITAMVIGLGWIINEYGLPEKAIPWIYVVLLGISILFGLFFLYKYKTYDSTTEGWEWINNLVERVYQVFPQIALVPPLIVVAIVVTQNISKFKTEITNNIKTEISNNIKNQTFSDFEEIDNSLSTITTQLSKNEQTLNRISAEINNSLFAITTQLTKNEQTLNIIATEIHNMPYCPTTEVSCSECPTITPIPKEITGCVRTHALNVRNSPGVKDSPSNHAKIWLKKDACVTILETLDYESQQWATIRTDKGEQGCVRLNKGKTEYVVTVTPTPTPP